MRNLLCRLFTLILLILLSNGCGTDTQPTYFINMLKDESDIDRLSECLVEEPVIEGDTITIKSNIPCLTELSKYEVSDTPDFQDVIKYPETYMDRLITFEAVVKKLHGGEDSPELFTNDLNVKFRIYSHGADVYVLNDKGEEVSLSIGEKYRFRCRIYQIEKNIDRGDTWQINAEFIVSQNKKIIHPPEPVTSE